MKKRNSHFFEKRRFKNNFKRAKTKSFGNNKKNSLQKQSVIMLFPESGGNVLWKKSISFVDVFLLKKIK
jgi:hypothetical protein